MDVDHTENWKSYAVLVFLFFFLFLLTIYRMIDTDVWFHMKAGQVISETGRFIYKDIFSFTAAGRDWLYHEWLFGVISYYVYSIFGINGLILGKAILLTLTFVIIYNCMRLRGANPYLSFFILFIAVLAARFRFTERPHVFKFLFVAAFIYLLDLYRLKDKKHLWPLPFLQLLWTNIHGSFILGPAIIAIYLFTSAVSGKRHEIRILTTIFILTSLATILNPYGIELLSFSLGFGEKKVLSSITEWSPTTLQSFGGAFGFLFITGSASFILKYRRIEIVDVLVFSMFAYLSTNAIRFTALFSLAIAPIIAGNIQYLASTLRYSHVKKWSLVILSLIIIGYLSINELRRHWILVFGLGQGGAFSEKAVDFIKKHPIDGNMYNSYVLGGYLIWSLYPERKVFVDGRAEIYDKEFQEAFISGSSMNKWSEAIDKYGISYAVIAYHSKGLDPIGKEISIEPQWVLIYWDGATRIYVRDIPRNQDIINRYGHRVMVSPVDLKYEFLKDAVDRGLSGRLEVEFKSDIDSNSENTKARYWLGMLYYETNRKEDALTAWKEAIKIRPDANAFSSIGNIYAERGMNKEAISYYKRAVETDKRFATGWYNIGNAYEMLNQKEEAVSAYRKFIKYAGPEYANEVKALKDKLK